MRRIVGSTLLVPMFVLLLAAPAAAAPPLRESGTQESMSAGHSTCGPSTCTDTFVDAFTVAEGVILVCYSEFTFNIRNGRVVSQESGCSEASSDQLTVNDDLSATLAPTAVTLVTCGPRGCVEGDTLIVSAALTGSGPTFTHSDRGTFSDGECTFRFRSSGTHRGGSGTLTVDGTTLSAFGFFGVSQFTVSSRCG